MAYKNIEDILESHKELIDFKEYHIIINSKLQTLIYEFVEEMKIENKKEFIKNELSDILELKDSDIVLLKKEHIFVKISKDKKLQQKERRFNGIDEDELADFHDENFSKTKGKIFFKKVVQKFIKKYFVKEKIDNNKYEKNVFSSVQAIMIEVLLEDFDRTSEFVKGFSGYLFRINFTYVFEQFADYILKEISHSNEYMIEFLKYYSLNIVIVKGVKYKVPLLLSDEGMKWNVISMLSIAKIYTRTKIYIKELKQETQELDKQIVELYIHGRTPVQYNSFILKKRQELERQLSSQGYKLKKTLELLQITKDEDTQSIYRQEVIELKEELKEIKEDVEHFISKELSKSKIENYIRFEKNLDAKMRDLKAHEKILTQNTKAFLSIKSSLVKALISKKQKL